MIAAPERVLTRDDWADAAVFPPHDVPRRIWYAGIGACLAQGAAAGLLLVRLLRRRDVSLQGARQELAKDLGTFLYVATSTTAVFSLFGGLVGRYADRLAELATTDALTGLLNTRALEQRLHEEIGRAARYRQPLSLLIVDVDGLKRINDAYGHDGGNEALRRVAEGIREELREADFGARLGGDEFGVLAPNTSEAAALVLSERLRARVDRLNRHSRGPVVTVSIGVGSFAAHDRTPNTGRSLMRAADAALYRAKRNGGNCVVGEGRLQETVS